MQTGIKSPHITRPASITIPATTISPGELMDRAMDKLRTAHLALAPDNRAWHDDRALMSVWATLEQVIRDLELAGNRLQSMEDAA